MRHTAECENIAALVELTTELIREAYGRGDLPHYLGTSAQHLTAARSVAHVTCVTHAVMFKEPVE